jgi:hypothetical protein
MCVSGGVSVCVCIRTVAATALPALRLHLELSGGRATVSQLTGSAMGNRQPMDGRDFPRGMERTMSTVQATNSSGRVWWVSLAHAALWAPCLEPSVTTGKTEFYVGHNNFCRLKEKPIEIT